MSYKIEDLKSNRIAIHCHSEYEWNKVESLWGEGTIWMYDKDFPCFCLHPLGYGSVDFYVKNEYTIIDAADFIKANTETPVMDLSKFDTEDLRVPDYSKEEEQDFKAALINSEDRRKQDLRRYAFESAVSLNKNESTAAVLREADKIYEWLTNK